MNNSVIRAVVCVLWSCVVLCMATVAAPELTVESNNIDLGTVERGAVVKKAITLKNTGDQPLELTKVQSSCPCAIVELPPPDKRVIPPGGSFDLPITYDTKDRYGEAGATIAINTNDPEQPVALLELGIVIESLVIFTPETGVAWTMAPRGSDISTPLQIMAGKEDADVELLEFTMAQPGITPHPETREVNGRKRIRVTFSIDPDTPMGVLTNEARARVRVGETEAMLTVPLRGGVIGDILITPPAIISPRTAYQQGGRISEITVRSSHPGTPAPDLIGVQTVGPLQATIEREQSDANQHLITVATANDAPGGPQAGTVYIMTGSADDPIVAVPVYFRMGESVAAKPDHAVLYLNDPARNKQRIALHHDTAKQLTITGLEFDAAAVNAEIVASKENAPPSIDITAVPNSGPNIRATIITIQTDLPGAESIPIPVMIREGLADSN